MPKTIGVLGGMGPEAGAVFCQRIIRLTPAAKDQDHFRLILLSDPTIPDRSRAILGQGPSPQLELNRCVQQLEAFGAELIAIPCNTAHYFWRGMQDSVSIPVLNILEETVRAVFKTITDPAAGPIGVLATSGTIQSRLYQSVLEAKGFSTTVPDPDGQQRMDLLIEWIKSGVKRQETLRPFENSMAALTDGGACGIILGCTELGMLTGEVEAGVPLFDSLELLARASIRMALHEDRELGLAEPSV